MDFTEFRSGDALTLLVHAPRIDGVSAPDFHEGAAALIEDSDKSLTLDFADVKYISSAGLRILLILAKDMRQKGGSMSLANPIGPVRDVLTITGFNEILGVKD